MTYAENLLKEAKKKYSLSKKVCEAYLKTPRHLFLTIFSTDYHHWLGVTPETIPLVYDDKVLLLYEKDGFVSTITQPSFVLRLLDLLDLHEGMRVFEVGAGSGWNAALMGHLVGKNGSVISYEIIPEMALSARKHLLGFDLPQVKVIPGDALEEIRQEQKFDRGIFTAGARDMPGILFDVIKDGGKLIFVLKTSHGDLMLAMIREHDHFKVYHRMNCHFVSATGPILSTYQNDLSMLYYTQGEIKIYTQGTMGLRGNVIAGRDMIFEIT